MAQHYLDVFGRRYYSSEPAFFTEESGRYIYDRLKDRYLDWPSVQATATAIGHSWQPREIGIPSIRHQLANTRGHSWAPGLDDTNGLASEQVTNGEDFTGATGATPPTGWVAGGATPAYQLFGGTVGIGGNDSAQTMTQTLTGLTPGTYYVLETSIHEDSNAGRIIFEGLAFPIQGPKEVGDEFRLVAFSFMADADGTAQIGVGCDAGGYIAISFIRVYEESELTGNPGAGGGSSGGHTSIHGPYMAGDTKYWINTQTGDVGFDVDADPAADVWLSGVEVCDSEIDDDSKMMISSQLVAMGCAPLPCIETMHQDEAPAKAKKKAKKKDK